METLLTLCLEVWGASFVLYVASYLFKRFGPGKEVRDLNIRNSIEDALENGEKNADEIAKFIRLPFNPFKSNEVRLSPHLIQLHERGYITSVLRRKNGRVDIYFRRKEKEKDRLLPCPSKSRKTT